MCAGGNESCESSSFSSSSLGLKLNQRTRNSFKMLLPSHSQAAKQQGPVKEIENLKAKIAQINGEL